MIISSITIIDYYLLVNDKNILWTLTVLFNNFINITK